MTLILIFFILFNIGCNKEEKTLKTESIVELMFLISFNENHDLNRFNEFFTTLRYYPAKDSFFFLSKSIEENNKSDYLILGINDSLKIYRPLKKLAETYVWYDLMAAINYVEGIKLGTSQHKSFKEEYTEVFLENDSLGFTGLWYNRNDEVMLFIEDTNESKSYMNYCYEKSLSFHGLSFLYGK